MNIIGCLIWWIFGAMFIFVAEKAFNKKQIDYNKYTITDAEVIGTHEFYGNKWMVKFTDKNGAQVIGADDIFAEGTFHPKNYSLPKRGNVERVYYWPNNHQDTHSINGIPINYNIHFCNENFYTLRKEKERRWRKIFWIVGVFMCLVGLAILFFWTFII